MKRNRNYLIAWLGCIACTVLAFMTDSPLEDAKWYIMSDINVTIWLFVAWIFDELERG